MKTKRILAALLALLVMLTAAGCGTSGVKTSQADTDAVKAALEKFAACESFCAVQRSERQETVTADDVSYAYSGFNEMAVELIYKPEARMKATITAKHEYDGEKTEQVTLSYLVPEEGGYAEYDFDGTQWLKFTTEQSDVLEGSYAASVARSFYVDTLQFGKAGEDTLESGKAIRYEARLGGGELVAMLESSGHLLSISEMSENQQNRIKENLVKNLKSVPVCIWVDKESGYPVRFELSTTGILEDMQKLIAESLGNKTDEVQWAVKAYTASMVLSDFDAVESIELPPEAADALSYGDVEAMEQAAL